MTLAIGHRLGHYHVTALIGEGGMGQVYRAHDTRLNRGVALKLLPQAFAADPGRLARFQREAELLASLNHPGIAAIYGVEDAPSTGSGPAMPRALVLELVDGPTLADRIAQGPVSLDEALPIGRQIAEALEAAHDQGIVHRDLKPANIKLRTDGTVKVLDFGLAKAVRPASSDDLSSAPTELGQPTHAGALLGTVAYMSPEQARGEPANAASDVWAFGCVFFEMLTGSPAFSGPTSSEKIAAILRSEPDWTQLPAETPPAVRRLLRRSLRKSRQERIGHMEVVRFELADVFETDPPELVESTSRTSQWTTAMAAAALAGVAAGLLAVTALRTPSSPPLPVVRSMVATDPLYISSATPDLAISPDGRQVVYLTATNLLYVRTIDQLEPRLLLRPQGGVPLSYFVSPDSEWVGYFDTTRSELMKLPLQGGPPVPLCPYGGQPRGASWGPGGVVFASATADNGLFRVPESGGTAERLTTPQTGFQHWWPEVLPTGNILFTLVPEASPENLQIAALNPETGEQVVLLPGRFPRYLSSGHLAFGDGQNLRVIAFDPATLDVIGEAVAATDQAVVKSLGAVDFDVSTTGTLAYIPAAAADSTQRTLTWVDRDGREEDLTSARPFFQLAMSPDGSRVAALVIEPTNHDIWIYGLDDPTSSRLTFDPASDIAPQWTRDGQRVIFSSTRDGGVYNLFIKVANGMGQAKRLTSSPHTQNALTWSNVPGTLIFYEESLESGTNLLAMSLTGDRTPRPLLETPFNESLASLSPDGAWLAYQSDESGRFEVYVRPFPNLQDGLRQVSVGGGQEPVWGRDGRELFYRSGLAVMAVDIRADPGFESGPPRRLFEGAYRFGGPGKKFDYSVEEDRFLVIKEGAELPDEIVLVQNWVTELEGQLAQASF